MDVPLLSAIDRDKYFIAITINRFRQTFLQPHKRDILLPILQVRKPSLRQVKSPAQIIQLLWEKVRLEP